MKRKYTQLFWPAIYLLFVLALWFTDKYALQYIEQKQTFFADAGFLKYIISHIGGFAMLISSLIVQSFVSRVSGMPLTAALLTLSAFLGASVFKEVSGRKETALLALLPALGCIVQLCDMNFHFFGIIANILMLLCLYGYIRINSDRWRLFAGAGLTVTLFAAAGSVSLLFAVSALIIELFLRPKKAALFLILPFLAGLAGLVALNAGWASEARHVYGAFSYYTLRLKLPPSCMITWTLWVGALLAAGIVGLFRTEKKAFSIFLVTAETAALICFAFFSNGLVSKADKSFRELYILADDGEWERIIERCTTDSPDNLLFQNYLGIALAEKGLLSSKIFEFPVKDIHSLYVETNKTPYVSSLLSDVFFSIGELGLSQRYAFEANEAWCNYSPRLLKRLVITNLAFGSYEVAEKYLNLLDRTLFYKTWAKEYRVMLYDDEAVEANALVSDKRRCIFTDNKLSGLNGLDIDLKRIIRANPEHHTTMQYLGAMLLLIKNLEMFMDLMEEFHGTAALPEKLQPLFQQAICLYSNGDEEILQKFNVQQDTVDAYEKFKEKPSNWKSSYWFFYYYY